MIPILKASQIKEADKYTIENEPITSIELMERASGAFLAYFLDFIKNQPPSQITIFAGVGNNGGDALVIARLLSERSFQVRACIVGDVAKASEEFKKNFKRIKGLVDIRIIRTHTDIPILDKQQIIIDGIFGIGLSKPITGIFRDVVQAINNANSTIVSIDIASGLFADDHLPPELAVEPDLTITFQTPKWPFFHPTFSQWVGQLRVIDIGLNDSFLTQQKTNLFFTQKEDFNLLRRKIFSHKGNSGRVLLIAGSKGKMGAAILAARGIMRSGAGLLFMHVPKCGLDILQSTVPEAMILEEDHEEVVSNVELPSSLSAIAIGPGIGTNPITRKSLNQLLEVATCPMVIDADALNILARNVNMLDLLPEQSILTPHPKEFERLVGAWKSEAEKLEKLTKFCIQRQVNIVLKGAYSAVCNSEGIIFFNSTGNPGMATAGSGDVLTGVIAGIVGQGIEPEEALKLGVYIHGRAGDLAMKDLGFNGMTASDIIHWLPKAFIEFEYS